jgi:hypothetical protein
MSASGALSRASLTRRCGVPLHAARGPGRPIDRLRLSREDHTSVADEPTPPPVRQDHARAGAGAARALKYFDPESPESLARLSEPETALRPLKGLVVIDEIQRRPSCFRCCASWSIGSRCQRASWF